MPGRKRMVVEAHVRRSDLIAMNVALLFKVRANLYWFGLLVLIIGWSGRDLLNEGIVRFVAFTSLGAMVSFTILFGFGVLIQAALASEKQGFLGKHRFEIADDGFHEETEGTRSFAAWDVIRRVTITKRFIYVVVSAYCIHVIPRRAFESDAGYESFGDELQKRLRSA